MCLQKAPSGLNFTFSLLLHPTLLAHQLVSTCPRVGSCSDITAFNVPEIPDTLPGLGSTLDSDVKVFSCRIITIVVGGIM